MGVCFLCDENLHPDGVQVCTSITPHSMEQHTEKISELLGEEFAVIVTSADHVCNLCNTRLTDMNKWECDLKKVKNSIMSCIHKKYGILTPDRPEKSVMIVNGNLKVEELLEQGQLDVSSNLTLGVSPAVTAASVVTPVQTSFESLKTQQFQPQQQQLQEQKPQQQQSPQQPPPSQQKYNNTSKLYKCSFCSYQSKKLGYVRFHLRSSHTIEKEPETPILNPAVVTPETPQQQQLQQKEPQQQPQQPLQKKTTVTMYTCSLCEFKSKLLGVVQAHTCNDKHNTKHRVLNINSLPRPKKNNYPFKCKMCIYKFAKKADYLDHIKKKHKSPTPKNQPKMK